jgi:hypothetical protein
MEALEITINTKVNQSVLSDMIVSAIEGGSNYWYFFHNKACDAINKHRKTFERNGKVSYEGTFSESILAAVTAGEKIPVHDIEDPDGSAIGELSLDSLHAGFAKMQADGRCELNLLFDAEADYDAEDADVIFQYITLGELIYG